MKIKFIDEVSQHGWRYAFKKLWSLQVIAFWCAMSALVFIWPGLIEVIPTPIWAAGGFIIAFSIGIARVVKQPGSEGI